MFLTAKKTYKQTKFIRVSFILGRKYVTQEKHARYSNAQKMLVILAPYRLLLIKNQAEMSHF